MQPANNARGIDKRYSLIEQWDIRERDIDLLLAEELNSSVEFQRQFIAWTLPEPTPELAFKYARHSVWTPSGQSDVEAYYGGPDGRHIAILIENKVAAGLMPDQAARYHERGRLYTKPGGPFSQYVAVLTAPRSYTGGSDCGFHRIISYEAIRDWFACQEQMGARREWKVALLVAAIEFADTVDHGGRGVPPITAFWRQYWLLATGKAPDLRMREPGPKAGGFLYFNPEGLLSRLKLVHRLTRGRVDLQFSGMAGSRSLMETQFGSLLRSNMHITRAGKSAVVQICVPPLDLMSDFSDQESSALKGLMAAWELWEWFRQNRLQILDYLRASMPGSATAGQ